MSRKPVVRLCRGSDCTRRVKSQARLKDLLVGRVRVLPVKCQKICEGPVIGLEVDGEMEWFEKVRGREVRGAVEQFLDQGTLEKPLRKRRVKKRSGQLR